MWGSKNTLFPFRQRANNKGQGSPHSAVRGDVVYDASADTKDESMILQRSNSNNTGKDTTSKVFAPLLLDAGLNNYDLRLDSKDKRSRKKKESMQVHRRLFVISISIFGSVVLLKTLMSGNEEIGTRSLLTLLLSNNPDASAIDFRNPRENQYCPDVTDFFDLEDIERAASANHLFHSQGGNLKSVQQLLDNNIDATVHKIGATFIPYDKSPETQQVTKYLEQHFQANYDPRGGYGRPLPGQYNPSNHPLLLEGRYVEVADPVNSRERWDASLGPSGPECNNLLQLGKTGRDGTKWYCQPVNKDHQQIDNGSNVFSDCHVISIGGNDNWDFEVQVVEEMKGCQTHTFDCTLQGGQPKRKPNRDDIHFYPYCINDHNYLDEHGREYLTYFDIIAKAGLKGPPTLFKMDVEGFEFDIFSHMIQKANNHHHQHSDEQHYSYWLPQQMQVELHWATRMRGVSWMARTRTSAELALLSGMMFTGGGYMPIFQNWDKGCPSCIEVLYFRLICY